MTPLWLQEETWLPGGKLRCLVEWNWITLFSRVTKVQFDQVTTRRRNRTQITVYEKRHVHYHYATSTALGCSWKFRSKVWSVKWVCCCGILKCSHGQVRAFQLMKVKGCLQRHFSKFVSYKFSDKYLAGLEKVHDEITFPLMTPVSQSFSSEGSIPFSRWIHSCWNCSLYSVTSPWPGWNFRRVVTR